MYFKTFNYKDLFLENTFNNEQKSHLELKKEMKP